MLTLDPQPVAAIVSAIAQECSVRGFELVANPEELVKSKTKSATMKDTLSGTTNKKTPLRPEMKDIAPPAGLYIESHSSYAIQVGQLEVKLTPGEWSNAYRDLLLSRWHGYQQYAATARTWLQSNYSDDLNLFLVGPPGSKDEAEWRNFSEVIERNELVCRKLVWLPSKNEQEWPAQIDEFIERTFLAEPWKVAHTSKSANLDALSGASDDFSSWQKILERPEFRSESRDHDDLVKALLESLES
ncbi:ABC-three component system middle component 1 [Rhodopirellula bahusiensis]|nr:ABC-three component system middle component 1 [Rhodopirellula bahusiensis]